MSMNNQTLCLTCSASLPPLREQERGDRDCFITRCCNRAICPKCLIANPRLSRYNPCLACLAGVSAVASSSKGKGKSTFSGTSASNSEYRGGLQVASWSTAHAGSSLDGNLRTRGQPKGVGCDDALAIIDVNVDGSLRDGDLFIVGDDDDGEEEDERGSDDSGSPPPPYSGSTHVSDWPPLPPSTPTAPRLSDNNDVNEDNTNTQHMIITPAGDTISIDKSDTLVGIALKYGVDVRVT